MEKQITEQDFLMKVSAALEEIGIEFSGDDLGAFASDYCYIASYVTEKRLFNAALALPLVYSLMTRAAEQTTSRFRSDAMHRTYFQHSLAVCRMLIDLYIPLTEPEEDVLLASALCHVLPENLEIPDLEGMLTRCNLSPEVPKIVKLLFWKDNDSGAEEKAYFVHVRENKLALMVKLVDRANLVEQLYGISNWSARRYIYETRNFFFPMCIYAKEHYQELQAPVNVMMEKMRCLIEVAEILLGRYETREQELTQDILRYQEENAMFRSVLKMHQE